jgi:ribosome-associated protein
MSFTKSKRGRAKPKAAGRPPASAAKKAAKHKNDRRKVAERVSAKPKPAPVARARGKASSTPLLECAHRALDDMKAVNVAVLDVRDLTDVADTMMIASGNSDRHVRAIADRVVEFAKQAGFRPMGVEGKRDGEWVLVDLQDVVVHVMLPRVREFYRLEALWDVAAARREAVVG